MTDQSKCPSCGASNPPGSPWCNQCFSALGASSAPAPPDPVPQPPDPLPPSAQTLGPAEREVGVAASDQSAQSATDTGTETVGDGPTWACRVCQEVNPLTSNVCSVCQTPIFVSFGAEQEAEPALSPSDALTQAFVPGLAHIRLGHGLIGFTIGLLVWVLIGFALVIAFAGGAPVPVLFVFIVAIAIVLVSAHDAQRLAQREPDAVILKPRILTFVALGAIALVVAIIWIQGLAGASANT